MTAYFAPDSTATLTLGSGAALGDQATSASLKNLRGQKTISKNTYI